MAEPNTAIGVADWIAALRKFFSEHARAENAVAMRRYMQEQFPFFGIKTPLRKELVRRCRKAYGLPDKPDRAALFRACFEQPEREFQYVVNDLGRSLLPQLNLDMLPVIETLIARKSWWDTVDFLAPKLAGGLLKKEPAALKATAKDWVARENRWYQRSAILLQLDYKECTDRDLLFYCIRKRADSPEFFVQKAAGWALRQYSRVEPEIVMDFVRSHKLAPLTVREGLKLIKTKRK